VVAVEPGLRGSQVDSNSADNPRMVTKNTRLRGTMQRTKHTRVMGTVRMLRTSIVDPKTAIGLIKLPGFVYGW